METKLFELRDSATFIVVAAVKVEPRSEEELYLIRRSGYGDEGLGGKPYIIMFGISGHPEKATYSPYDWDHGRTRGEAHKYIIDQWDNLKSGYVIDVEHILGETEKPKESERISYPMD